MSKKRIAKAEMRLKGYVISEPKRLTNGHFSIHVFVLDNKSLRNKASIENINTDKRVWNNNTYQCIFTNPNQIKVTQQLIKKNDYILITGQPLINLTKGATTDSIESARIYVIVHQFDVMKTLERFSVEKEFNNEETFYQQQSEEKSIQHFFET
jgi:hypothetical protein